MVTDGNKFTREVFGLFFLFIGLLVLLSLFTFDPLDPHMHHVVSGIKGVKNQAGRFGAYTSGFLQEYFGLAAYGAPLFFLTIGAKRVLFLGAWPWWRWFGFFLFPFCLAIAGTGWELHIFSVCGGGWLGRELYRFSIGYFGQVGTFFVWGFLLLLSVQLASGISWLRLTLAGASALLRIARKAADEIFSGNTEQTPSAYKPELRQPAGRKERRDLSFDDPPAAPSDTPKTTNLDFLEPPGKEALEEPPWVQALENDAVAELAQRDKRTTASSPRPSQTDAKIVIHEIHRPQPAEQDAAQRRDRRIPLPPLSLLHSVASAFEHTPRHVLEEKGKILMACLANFDVQGELVGITPGPVVTMFEIRPAPGVSIARFERLDKDLALALKAIAVRIQAPIPGTDTVGIEIPNEKREIVCLKEFFSSQTFAKADSLLTMAIGKDISGQPIVADLAHMPHLLVAGATGAGKSVCLNAIVLSLLYKARPDEVKLLLVDPKRIEMAVYADLPHLVHPVVTEMSLAKNALDWAVAEMERRFAEMERLWETARLRVRDITAYNEKLRELGEQRVSELADFEPMPYLVIIIDEFGDLILTIGKEVENSIARLGQKARAAGIHLILATQRPSVNVVTGLIKTNVPCRISFYVPSKVDSRIVLDALGAENLLGKGDMLFKPGGGRFQRLHGAYVRDDDVAAVVDYWKEQQKPEYAVDFNDFGDVSGNGISGAAGGDDVAADPMYAEVVDFVRQQGKVSISLIQRRFRIGFNKAARFVEQMEKDGIVGPSDGAKPRTIR